MHVHLHAHIHTPRACICEVVVQIPTENRPSKVAAVYLSLMNEYLYIMMYTNMFRIDVSSWHDLYVNDV